MKKRIINLIILLSGTLFIFIIVTGKVNVECLFKKIFHISCPGCGLTRSFRSILNLDFINAFKYKILYFNGEVLMFRNHWKYQKNFLTKELIVQTDDYFIEDEEGIIFKVSSLN